MGSVSGERNEPEQEEAPDMDDPRDRDRQVADIVAMVCAKRLAGEPTPAALWGALADSSAPVSADIAAVVAQSCHLDSQWSETATVLHRLARRWRSPILATLADAYSDGGGALRLDYLQAVATGTGVEHSVPPQLALKREKHPRHGSPWDEDEDRRLLAAVRGGATVDLLCEQHQRNENAIRARLLKLGVIGGAGSGGSEAKTDDSLPDASGDVWHGYEVRRDVDLPGGQAVWAVTRVGEPLSEEEKARWADWSTAVFTPLEEVDAQLAEELAGVLIDELLRHGGLSAHRKDEASASLRLHRGVTQRGSLIIGADLPLGVGHSEYEWDGSRAEALQVASDIGKTAGINIRHERDLFGPTGWEPEYDGGSP
jgi:hypothetical protein